MSQLSKLISPFVSMVSFRRFVYTVAMETASLVAVFGWNRVLFEQ